MQLLYLYTDVKIYFQITTCNPTYNSNWNSFDDLHGHHFASEVTSPCPDDTFALLCRRSWLRLQHAMTVKLIIKDAWLQHKMILILGIILTQQFLILDIRLFGHVHNLLEQCRHTHRGKWSSMERKFALSQYLRRTWICSSLLDDLAKTYIPPWKLSLIMLTLSLLNLPTMW